MDRVNNLERTISKFALLLHLLVRETWQLAAGNFPDVLASEKSGTVL